MANSHQMEQAIHRATEEVAEQGWENADLRLVMLAGFGYLAHELTRARQPRWNLRWVVPVLLTVGAGIGGGVLKILGLGG